MQKARVKRHVRLHYSMSSASDVSPCVADVSNLAAFVGVGSCMPPSMHVCCTQTACTHVCTALVGNDRGISVVVVCDENTSCR